MNINYFFNSIMYQFFILPCFQILNNSCKVALFVSNLSEYMYQYISNACSLIILQFSNANLLKSKNMTSPPTPLQRRGETVCEVLCIFTFSNIHSSIILFIKQIFITEPHPLLWRGQGEVLHVQNNSNKTLCSENKIFLKILNTLVSL